MPTATTDRVRPKNKTKADFVKWARRADVGDILIHYMRRSDRAPGASYILSTNGDAHAAQLGGVLSGYTATGSTPKSALIAALVQWRDGPVQP